MLKVFKNPVDPKLKLKWLAIPDFLSEKSSLCQKIALLLSNLFKKIHARQTAYLDLWVTGET